MLSSHFISIPMVGIRLLVLALVVAATGCHPDEAPLIPPADAQLTLHFEPRFQGGALALHQRENNLHGYTFEVYNLKFYLAGLTLHGEAGDLLLTDIALIDLSDTTSFPDFNVPPGTYSGISFDLGVPPELNGTQNPDFTTSLYSADHPLSESNGMYWAWALGYRFFTFEGRYDTLPDTQGLLPEVFAFHTGLDTLFRRLPTFDIDLALSGGESESLRFGLSVDSLFASSVDTLDLRINNSFHGNNLPVGIKAANNSARCFVLLD